MRSDVTVTGGPSLTLTGAGNAKIHGTAADSFDALVVLLRDPKPMGQTVVTVANQDVSTAKTAVPMEAFQL